MQNNIRRNKMDKRRQMKRIRQQLDTAVSNFDRDIKDLKEVVIREINPYDLEKKKR